MIPVKGPDGKTYRSAAALCRVYGVSKQIYFRRIENGWDKDKALLFKPGSAEALNYSKELKEHRVFIADKATGPKKVFVRPKTANAYTLPVKGFIW